MAEIEIIIKEDGKQIMFFVTDKKGTETVQDLNVRLASIVGERSLRKEKR